MGRISDQLRKLEDSCRKLNSEKRSLSYISDLLTLQHQVSFYAFLNGLETRIEYYLDKRNDEYFAKLLELRNMVCNKNMHQIKLVRGNGYYI